MGSTMLEWFASFYCSAPPSPSSHRGHLFLHTQSSIGYSWLELVLLSTSTSKVYSYFRYLVLLGCQVQIQNTV